ncbi:MAG: CARDB domain-containing protein [Pirellulales bacterium]|nr:CARDB domain-containing protein [Pirellulales bacterium]
MSKSFTKFLLAVSLLGVSTAALAAPPKLNRGPAVGGNASARSLGGSFSPRNVSPQFQMPKQNFARLPQGSSLGKLQAPKLQPIQLQPKPNFQLNPGLVAKPTNPNLGKIKPLLPINGTPGLNPNVIGKLPKPITPPIVKVPPIIKPGTLTPIGKLPPVVTLPPLKPLPPVIPQLPCLPPPNYGHHCHFPWWFGWGGIHCQPYPYPYPCPTYPVYPICPPGNTVVIENPAIIDAGVPAAPVVNVETNVIDNSVEQAPEAPTATTDPALGKADLTLQEVRLLEAGDLNKNVGPLVAVTVANTGDIAATKFSVAVYASLQKEPSPQMLANGTELNELLAGEIKTVEIRLPVEALALPGDGQTPPQAYEHLFVVADVRNEVIETDEADNLLPASKASLLLQPVKVGVDVVGGR